MPTVKELAFDLEHLKSCDGYTPKYIDKRTVVSLDKILPDDLKKDLPVVDGNTKNILNYCDFSILYNKKRRVPFVVAYNIDGTTKANQLPRPGFRPDPRISEKAQLDKGFFDLEKKFTEFEIGHMASNNEMGRGKNGPLKAYQTFHFTNSVPQVEVLNTGLWKGLESYIIKEAATVKNNKRICVFTGPVLKNNDPKYVNDLAFRVPLIFYKVVVFMHEKGLFATAFIISHEKKLIEDKLIPQPAPVRRIRRGEKAFMDFPYKAVFQVNIPFLEKLSGLKFSWRGVKAVEVPQQKKLLGKIKGIKNADDAKKAIRRGGPLPVGSKLTAEVTKTELKTGNYLLNMTLP